MQSLSSKINHNPDLPASLLKYSSIESRMWTALMFCLNDAENYYIDEME